MVLDYLSLYESISLIMCLVVTQSEEDEIQLNESQLAQYWLKLFSD